uniref:Cytochrome P450 n=1 Tax=Acrobeloides nanus TaxID=290746 RepID=A0A914CPE7_9BILA
MPMVSSVLYDEKIFPEPFKFKPERFLDSNGNNRKIDEFIPFSVGRRQCLGESLARMEMFLFVANIFNQFKISAVDGKEPSLERQPGVTFTPLPFVCNLEKRY